MATVLTPESSERASALEARPMLFIAGTIDMGLSRDWQSEIELYFKNKDVVLLNPRRRNWDSSWIQDISNDEFRNQVQWELEMLEIADAILIHFEPGSKSPISIAEFAFYAGRNSTGCLNKTIVSCPKGFWRKGNIDIMAERYHIPVVEVFENLISEAENLMRRNHQRRLDFQELLHAAQKENLG